MDGGNWKEMFNAAVAGELWLVEFHVKSGVDVNYAHPEFLSTPLVAAILARQPAVVAYLLQSGALPNLGSEFDGVTPLQAARQTAQPALETLLLGHGATPLPPEAAPRTGFAAWWARLTGRSR